MAVSSLVTYDIYRAYIKPGAKGPVLLTLQRVLVIGYGCLSGVAAIILMQLYVAGVSVAQELRGAMHIYGHQSCNDWIPGKNIH